MGWVWTTLPLFVFLYLLKELLSKYNRKKLPPGPKGLPILGHFHLLGKNPHQDFYHLAQKHGPIMYMHFGFVPIIVVSSPAGAELILKTHDVVFASRPSQEAAKYIAYGQKNITFGLYGPYWRNMRKLCTSELFSNLRISQFQNMRRAEIGSLISSLKQDAKMHNTVDVTTRVSSLTADMICLIVFGKKYDDKDLNENGFKAVVTEALELGGAFNLGDYFPGLGMFDLQGLTRRLKRMRDILDGFLEKIINDHVRNKKAKNQTHDFVDTMVAVMESEKPEFEFDRAHIKAVLVDMLLAGMDTSATVIDWTISELIKHPQTMKKLQKELETVVGMEQMVDESHLDNLKYLEMVVKESLRLHPVVPMLLPHESTEDCTIDGFHIPKGSRILVNAWAIGRDPKAWPDPHKFLPDRFIGNNLDVRGRDFQLIPFGSGRRGCPGLQLGLVVVKLVVAQLVHCFDWELPDGMLSSDLDMTDHFSSVTARVNHLLAIPTYRLHK